MSNRESNASRRSAPSPAPSWGPPKTPLSPDRLAKLANALGVSTPLPAVAPSVTHTFSSSPTSLSSPFRGSPVPSRASSRQSNVYASPMTSRYLLHVIPPLKLPHDIDVDYDSSAVSKTPPLPTAPGYHTQFRRGVLVPVHSTLQSQLSAIAKEYALPSTTGLILYLVQSNSQNGSVADTAEEGPGARLSEEIWRHLWLRVVKSEQGDDMQPSRSLSPNNLGLGVTMQGARSTPHLLAEGKPFRPLLSSAISSDATLTPAIAYPTPTTPSTASAMSHSNSLKSDRSIQSSNAVSSEESGPGGTDTPDTSRANSFDLPGLGSSSIIPILAKVEFDIDKHKATWFGPWIKNRKRNHAERQGSMDHGPVTLKLPKKMQAKPGWLDQGGEEVESPIGSDSEYEDDTTGQPGLTRQNTLNRDHIPAPLMIPSSTSLSSGEDTGRITNLPYLQGSYEDLARQMADNGTFKVRRATGDSVDKRGGGVFDDLDLGLEDSLDDLYDQQYALSAELDELEKSMAQNSPRPLKYNLSEEQNRNLAVEALTGQGDRSSQLGLPDFRTPPRSSSVSSSSPTVEGSSELEVPTTPQLTLNGVSASSPGPTPPPKSPQHQNEVQNSSHPASSSRNSPETPLIPLSPDPFGRFPTSTRTSHDAGSSRQSSTYWETPSSAESVTTASRNGRSMDAERSSRFSADSTHEIDAVAAATAAATGTKPNRTTMMSVKGIKKLWRRSNKQSVSGPPVPSNTEPSTPRTSNVSNVSSNGASSATNNQASQQQTQQRTSNVPQNGGLGPPSRPSRTSGGMNPPNSGLGAPSRPERPSQDELDIPDIPQHLYVPAPPPFNSRNSGGTSPIIPSKMMPSRSGNGLDRLHFDQESPYPMPSRRSPPSRPYQQNGPPPPPPASAPADLQANGVRKSILKWKNAGHSSQSSIGSTQGSGENVQHLHVRRPSGSSTGPSRGPSPSSMGPPPSPRIPEQFLNSKNNGHLTTPSMDSQNSVTGDRPNLMRTSSLASQLSDDAHRPSLDTRPSIDSSQFEMVSPKVGTLTYPYTDIEERPQP